MVIKRTNQSGGYGTIMGNTIEEEEWLKAKETILAEPEKFYCATHYPAFDGAVFYRWQVPAASCRPEAICFVRAGWRADRARRAYRVALREGSLVVNSSQGGGSKGYLGY